MRGSGGHTGRRSWAQRLFIAGNVMAILAAGLTAGVLAYGNRRLSGVVRVSLSDALADEELEEGDPENFLLVGIDDASGLPQGDSVRNRSAYDLAGQHTDTIMILRLDPKAETAQVLSLPRDLWLPIADIGTKQRINAALVTGGPGRLIRTIDENLGIPIHHYLQVDMAGFRRLVEIVDGVPVVFPRPARDTHSGLSIPEAGCYTLGPVQALGFARGRYYDVQDEDGRWRRAPGDDLGRNRRQQLFVQLALSRAFSKGARNLNTLRQLIDLGAGSVTFDDVTGPGSLVDLGNHFRSFDPEELQTFNLPVTPGTAGEAQVVFLQEDPAELALSVFRGTDPDTGAHPEDVTVQVLNGTGARGQGSEVTGELIAAGFGAQVPEDADEEGGRTTIRYAEGTEAEARLLARHVAGPVRYEVDPALEETAQVVLVTGTDWDGVAPTPKDLDAVKGPTTTTTTTTTAVPGEGEGEGDDEDGDGGGSGASTGPEVAAKDPLDVGPDDPLFYEALAPPPDASCPPTP